MYEEMEMITPRQLRRLLFYLPSDMTVEELRHQLFRSPNMDEEFVPNWGLLERMMAAKEDEEESGQ